MIAAIRRTLRKRFELSRPRLCLKLCKFGDDGWVDKSGQWHESGHYSLLFFGLWIVLWKSKTRPQDGMMDAWGIELYERSLYLQWGKRHKFILLPWSFDYQRTEVMLENGSFVEYERFKAWSFDRTPEPENRYRRIVPYRYVLKSGEVQEVQATITVQRMTWRWRLAKMLRLPWPRKVRTSIEIEFSDEVGERRGSWKGGCTGCDWGLKRSEDPIAALRRMEAEREFN